MKKKSIIIMSAFAFVLLLTGCSKNNTEQPAQSKNTTESTSVSSSNTKDTVSTSESSSTAVTNDLDSILQAYKDKFPDTTITSVEYDSDFGKFYYEVKGVDDDTEYGIKLDPETNKILKDKKEKLDLDEQEGRKRENDALALENLKSIDDILNIAKKEVPNSELDSWELDTDVGITYFSIKLNANRQTTELKIDGQSGKVLEKELDD